MHTEYTMLMSAVLDGEATDAETQRLHAHVRVCVACAATWQRWRVVDRRLAVAPALAAPTGFAERVMARVDEAELRRRRVRWLGSGLVAGWLSLMLAAALLVGLVMLWLQGNTAQIAQLGATALQWGEALLLLARGALTAIVSLGAPILAAAVGILACATCALGAAWLKLFAQRGFLFGITAQVAR